MMIPHYRPSTDDREVQALRSVLASKQLAQGTRVAELERQLAQITGKKFCVAVSSGTTALILALRVLNVTRENEVIIPSYTCAALWHAVRALGATPVFADIETAYYNLDPGAVEAKVTSRTAAIIFPHMFGQPGRIQELRRLKLPIIEDIAQAVGATISGQPVGSFGDLTVISLYATKVIGAGEGGAVLADSKQLIAKIRDLKEYDEKENLLPRINAKLSDLTAAVALIQLEKLPRFYRRREQIMASYREILGNNIRIPHCGNDKRQSNYYRCIAELPELSLKDIFTIAERYQVKIRRPVFKPLHSYFPNEKLVNTETAWQRQFSIPIFPDMNESEQTRVTEFLTAIFEQHR